MKVALVNHYKYYLPILEKGSVETGEREVTPLCEVLELFRWVFLEWDSL